MVVLWIVLIIVAILIWLFFMFPIVQVIGNSMYPTYKDNEFLISTRFFTAKGIVKGDVLCFRKEGKVVIKRVADIHWEGKECTIYFLGDNSENSYDSRYYGWVSSKTIICKPLVQRLKV